MENRARMLDLQELLRGPRKGDALIPAPTALDRYGGNPADACARGYRLAANILAESIASRGEEAFLFYPLFFLYRHHVELVLKNLIFAFDDPGIRCVTRTKELSKADRAPLVKGRTGHSLQVLWDRLRPAVLALGDDVVPTEKLDGIDFYIQELNEIDPYSQNLRYVERLEETKVALEKAQRAGVAVDLRKFAEAMERLAGYLDGLDSYVAEIIQYHHGASA